MLPAVPLAEKVAYIPSFTLSMPFDWALLANGEKVFDEASYLARCPSEAPDLDENGEKFESRRSLNDGTENVKKGNAAPKIGEDYLTPTGYPVRVLGVQNGSMVLQCLATDNRLVFPSAYPLEPFDEGEATVPLKPAPRQAGPGSNSPDAQARKQLAPIIDTLLLKGGATMLGIVRMLKRRASAACRGKDVKANVRARMYWFRRRGYAIDTDELGRLKARSPHETPAACGASVRGAF